MSYPSELRLHSITTDDVMSVYSGINGRCCCGCTGSHRANSKFDDGSYTVSDRSVQRILNSIKAGISTGTLDISSDGREVCRIVGNRIHIVYLVPGALTR